MIEGTRVIITNPKTFLDGSFGHITEKCRPGYYRVLMDADVYDERVLRGDEFKICPQD